METVAFLSETLAVLGAAVVVVVVSAKLRVPSVVGFLLSGILIGPSGLGLVPEVEQVETFAEIGVVLLLFVIGLQLSPSEMKSVGRSFLVGGSLQWGLTTGVTMAILVGLGLPAANALFIGFVVSLSSTAVVLKEYQERRETAAPQGRVVLGVLLFQDLLIVPMIALTPVLAGSVEASAGALVVRFGGALLAVTLVFVIARLAIARAMHAVVRTGVRELFVLGALATCLAMAWFTAQLGLSLALGAFLAGLLLAQTEYSHQVTADVGPFRDLFASVFFVSIGMLVDVSFAVTRLPLLFGVTAVLVVGKAVLAVGALKLGGLALRIATISGIGLAQIGEFSFVIMDVGREHGLLRGDRFQILLAAAVMTVALTPLLVRVAPALARRIGSIEPEGASAGEAGELLSLSSHVVVIGYGLNGQILARVLQETHIPFVVVELDPDTVRRARGEGVPVLFGDAVRQEILERAGVERAKVVVFAISDFDSVIRGLRTCREIAPGVEILVRTARFMEIEDVRAAGASHVVAEEFESAIEIFTGVLAAYHVPRNVIRSQTRVLRGEAYRMLRSASLGEGSKAVLEALEAGTTDIYRVLEGGPGAGLTLRDLDLRNRTGASVIAVVRGDVSHPSPMPDMTLHPGDSLVLVGSHSEIDAAFRYLDGDPTEKVPTEKVPPS